MKMKFGRALSGVLTLAMMSTALVAPAVAQNFESPEFGVAVERYIRSNPDVLLEAINKYVTEQQASEARAVDEQTLTAIPELLADDVQTVVGNPNGTINMVYVLDAACVHCRGMSPVIGELIEANPDLRITQRWVPFLTPASEYAARVAILVSERHPDVYPEFYSTLMHETVPLTNDVVNDVVTEVVGQDALLSIQSDLNSDGEGARVAEKVAHNLDLVLNKAKIEGTPFIYVDGIGTEGMLRGARPTAAIQEIIDKVRSAN